jgi:hypothetical protein
VNPFVEAEGEAYGRVTGHLEGAGPTGGRMCPTQGPNCAGEVTVPPGTEQTRDWDVSHNPSWSNRQFPSDVDREQVLDNYQEGTSLECIPCNRGGGNNDSRFGG